MDKEFYIYMCIWGVCGEGGGGGEGGSEDIIQNVDFVLIWSGCLYKQGNGRFGIGFTILGICNKDHDRGFIER